MVVGCADPETSPAPAPLPVGDGLPESIEAVIFGSATPCVDDRTCESGICTYGSCIGVLLADQRWMHARATQRLLERVDGREELRLRVVRELSQIALRKEADTAYRSRALRALETLGDHRALRLLLADPSVRLADEAAISLVRLGDPSGLESVVRLAHGESVILASEALRALGKVPGDPSLVALLATLNPELDGPIVRASLDGLRALGDRRAIRPLTALLPTIPGHLRHRLVESLRELSEAQLDGTVAAWQRWVETHNPPAPPVVSVRSIGIRDEQGLPAPY